MRLFRFLVLSVPHFALLIVIVVASMLCIGTVHATVLTAFALLSALAFVWTLQRRQYEGAPSMTPAWVFFGLAGYSGLQALPLPFGMVETIAPQNAAIWTRAFAPLGSPQPAMVSLSLDPAASWVEMLRWGSYGMVFVLSASVAYKRSSRLTTQLVFLSALTASLLTVAHGLVGAEKVFGIYEPSFKPELWYLGPLLNPNNLAGYTNLGMMCGLGLMLSTKPQFPRWAVGLGVALIFGVHITSGSRGGVAFLLVGLVALVVITSVTRRRRAQSEAELKKTRIVTLVTIAFGAALAGLGASRQTFSALYNDNLDKLVLLKDVLPMIGDHPVVGVGRGAFETVFPAYQRAYGSTVYTHAENFVAQWLVEWGIPATVCALLAFGWFFRPSKLNIGSSSVNTGAYLGVVILLLHNLVDLGLEVPALCFAAAALLGALWGDAARVHAPRRRDSVAPLPRHRLQIAYALTAAWWLIGMASVLRTGGQDVADARSALSRAFIKDRAPRTPATVKNLWEKIEKEIAARPAEPYFSLLAASLAWQQRDREPMPWIQQTLERSKVNGKAHLLLARMLTEKRALAQARLEVRLAVSTDPSLASVAAPLATRLIATKDHVQAVSPAGLSGDLFRDLLAERLNQKGNSSPVVADIDAALIKSNPNHVRARVRRISAMIRQVEASDRCEGCDTRVRTHLRAIESAEPNRSTAAQKHADWLVAQGKNNEAERLLGKRCEGVDDLTPCLTRRTAIAATLKDPARLESASRALLASACIDAKKCAHLATWLGDLHRKADRHGAALTAYRRACREAPSQSTWEKLGDACVHFGMYAEALQAYRSAQRFTSQGDTGITKKIKQTRQKLGRRLINRP